MGDVRSSVVSITTIVNPHNSDGEVVAVYSTAPLTVEDVDELFKLYEAGELGLLVELPGCLSWVRDLEVEEVRTNISVISGWFCYVVGGLG
jgi:hypothetical protein